MTISITKEDAKELREDASAHRSDKCPKCDSKIKVGNGISMPVVCRNCDNVWQPLQMFFLGRPDISCVR